jgi:N-acetylmuramoyl-L-alanine amidase
MPAIYLSPSVQEYNPFIFGGSEEYFMNRIADAMVPYLRASEIGFARNNPRETLTEIIGRSNAENHELHLALHSNSSPEGMKGVFQGPDVYFFTTSSDGHRAADIFAENLKKVYLTPKLVTVIPTTILEELRDTAAPAILIQIAYHDNDADAAWVRDNIDEIGKNLAMSTAEYLDVPFATP